jgi:hypothetical protein
MFALIYGCRSIFIIMTFLAFLIAIPIDQALAALIGTPSSQEQAAGNLRAQILSFLAREEVRVALLQQGVHPAEVEARVAALTDDEIASVAQNRPDMPAGGMDPFAVAFLIIDGIAVLIGVCLLLLIWAGVELLKSNSIKEAPASQPAAASPLAAPPDPRLYIVPGTNPDAGRTHALISQFPISPAIIAS